MGLFNSLKKIIKDSLDSNVSGRDTHLQKNKTGSFEDFINDVRSKNGNGYNIDSSDSKYSSNEDLYRSGLKTIGYKETEDGEYIRDFNIKEKNIDLDAALRIGEQLLKSGYTKAYSFMVLCYLIKGEKEGNNYNKKILSLLEEGIKCNDIMSLRAMSTAYCQGLYGLPISLLKAKEYCEIAMQSGDPGSYTGYASICLAENDVEQCIEYLEEAISGGSKRAYIIMGELYLQGRGVAMNLDKAKECFKNALEAGHIDAYWRLGICYGQSNPKKAKKYYEQGASMEDPMSCYLYLNFLPQGDPKRIDLLRIAYNNGICHSNVYSQDPSKPFYTYKCDFRGESINVISQDQKRPSDVEISEAYAAKYGKLFPLSLLDNVKITRLN